METDKHNEKEESFKIGRMLPALNEEFKKDAIL